MRQFLWLQLFHLAAVTHHTAGIEAVSTVMGRAAGCPLVGTSQILLLFVHTELSPACVQTLAVQFDGGLGYENSFP